MMMGGMAMVTVSGAKAALSTEGQPKSSTEEE